MEFDPGLAIQEAKDAIRRYYGSDHDPFICLDLAHRNFEETLQKSSDPPTILEALIGLSYAYGYLADTEPPSCTHHARNAVATAERALSHFHKHFRDNQPIEGRAYDALGCALRQRYVYLGVIEDCDQALAAQQKSVELFTPNDSPLVCSVRRSHLIKALYVRSRGSRHDYDSHSQSLLDAVGTAYMDECNGASTAFTSINGGLLYLCVNLMLDGRFTEEDEPHTPPEDNDTSPTEGEPLSIEAKVQRTIEVMEQSYDIMLRLYGPLHTRLAAELGTFSASLLKVATTDREDLAGGTSDQINVPNDESFQLDLRYVPILMDILHTLVTYHERMPGPRTASLVPMICQRLHQILPAAHIERPELHYLLGQHLVSNSAPSGSEGTSITRAIKQFRKALGLAPGLRPSRDPHLVSLISAHLGSLYASGSPTQRHDIESILQELLGWTSALEIVASSNLDPSSKSRAELMLTEVRRAQNIIHGHPANTPETSPGAPTPIDFDIDLAELARSSPEGSQDIPVQSEIVEPNAFNLPKPASPSASDFGSSSSSQTRSQVPQKRKYDELDSEEGHPDTARKRPTL